MEIIIHDNGITSIIKLSNDAIIFNGDFGFERAREISQKLSPGGIIVQYARLEDIQKHLDKKPE